MEIRDLEGLGKAVHEENNGDAGLTTEVGFCASIDSSDASLGQAQTVYPIAGR